MQRLETVVAMLGLMMVVRTQEPCCSPAQWQSRRMSIIYDDVNPVNFVTSEYYDAWNERLAFETNTYVQAGAGHDLEAIPFTERLTGGSNQHTNYYSRAARELGRISTHSNFVFPVKVITDFKKGIQYYITNGNCTRTASGPMARACVPYGARPMGFFNLGEPNHSFDTSTFILGEDQYVVTKENCYPVQFLVGPVFFLYYNITSGIEDPSIFTPPSICDGVPVTETLILTSTNSMETMISPPL